MLIALNYVVLLSLQLCLVLFLFVLGSKSVESRKNRIFTEGWVEFASKYVAREVASTLNNTQVGGKRRSPWYSDLWNIKYLPRFTWGLLNERLAYERAVHKSRLRTEVAIVKKESEHFAHSVKQAKREKKLKLKNAKDGVPVMQSDSDRSLEVNIDTELNHRYQSSKDQSSVASNVHSQQLSQNKKDKPANSDFLRRIFSGGFQQ